MEIKVHALELSVCELSDRRTLFSHTMNPTNHVSGSSAMRSQGELAKSIKQSNKLHWDKQIRLHRGIC